eukprot:3489909-Pleurochrysis_carterae.AAC.1
MIERANSRVRGNRTSADAPASHLCGTHALCDALAQRHVLTTRCLLARSPLHLIARRRSLCPLRSSARAPPCPNSSRGRARFLTD